MATIRLTQDFKEFLQLLDSARIEYLLIGGYAVALYGHVRPTKDMDVWIAADPASQARLRDVLIRFGFAPESVHLPLFTEAKTVLRLGVPPNRLEILSEIAGVEFQECYRRRKMVQIEGLAVPVISYEDLKRNKSSTGRTHDLADVERLEQYRSNASDGED